MLTSAEWRRCLRPPMQTPRIPLLQLVGILKRHERLYQVLPTLVRAAQPLSRVLCQPAATQAPRNHRTLPQRRHTVNLRQEPAERGCQGKGRGIEGSQRRAEQEAGQAGYEYQ